MTRDALFFVAGLFLGLFLGNLAHAHEALTGWSYDERCCGGQDCREAKPGEVVLVHDGWYVTTTDEVMPIGDPHLFRSKDTHFHVCITTHHVDYSPKPHLLCLYAPPAEF